MIHFLENLAAALLIFACICAAGCWWVTRDVGQAVYVAAVDGGRE